MSGTNFLDHYFNTQKTMNEIVNGVVFNEVSLNDY